VVYERRDSRSRGAGRRTDCERSGAREVKLYFDLGVLAALSSVQVASSTGAAIAASRPVNDPSSQDIVIVKLKRALPPGTYRVSWHVVTIDQRQASGAYLFTVS
jgi:copper resistance protein C